MVGNIRATKPLLRMSLTKLEEPWPAKAIDAIQRSGSISSAATKFTLHYWMDAAMKFSEAHSSEKFLYKRMDFRVFPGLRC